MKYRLTGLVLGAALLGACSHAELRKMMHGDPERRVRITTESPAAAFQKLRSLEVFEAVAASGTCDAGKDVKCASVSVDWFRASRIQPLLGRAFVRDEDRSPSVAILSASYWERSYGKDPAILGRTIEFGEKKYTVVGILPREAGRLVDVYLPWTPAGDSMTLTALLRSSVSIKQAQAAADQTGAKVKIESVQSE